MNLKRILAALGLCLFALGALQGQPDIEDGEPVPEKPDASSLKPRPEDDPDAAAWVAGLSPSRPQMGSVEKGAMLRHCLSPDGARLYFFRDLNASLPAPRSARTLPPAPRYVLFSASPEGSQVRVLETGFDALAPLFLDDGRLLVVTRRLDLNGDGKVNADDDRSLVLCGHDGAAEREVCVLRPSETPLLLWKQGTEVLTAEFARDDVNGWIYSLSLSKGERRPLCRGFNVSLALEDGSLLIERLVARPPQEDMPVNPWGRMPVPADEEEFTDDTQPLPEAGLLDRCEHILFNPADGSERVLYSPSRRARLHITGEGSFFGVQESSSSINASRLPGGRFMPARTLDTFELLIVDDAEHYGARQPSLRNSYFPLAWIAGKGLLAVERSNLKTRLVLVDRSSNLNLLLISEFGFDCAGFCASADGLTLAWLSLEDTNQDGFLDPWQDEARPWFMRLAPR